MPNTNSDLATKQAAATRDPSSGIVNGDDALGTLLLATVVVTCPATPAVGDTLTLVPAAAVPVGAVVVPQMCKVYCVTDPGTLLTLDIGPKSLPQKYSSGLALTVAGSVSGPVNFAASANAPAGVAAPYRSTTQEAIVATVVTSTAVVATVLVFTICYRCKA